MVTSVCVDGHTYLICSSLLGVMRLRWWTGVCHGYQRLSLAISLLFLCWMDVTHIAWGSDVLQLWRFLELVAKMREMNMDKTELGALKAIVLFNPGKSQSLP